MFRYFDNRHMYHRDADSYKKYDFYDLATLKSYNNARDKVCELQKFYQDYPDSKVFQPEQFGLSWNDIHNCIDTFYSKMIAQESKRWRMNGALIWDGYFRSKFKVEEKWKCPTLFVGVLLYFVWAIIVLSLGVNIEWYQFLLIFIFVIPEFALGYLLSAYVVQLLMVIIQGTVISHKQNKIIKWFMTTEAYTIIKAQNRVRDRIDELGKAFDF